MVIHVYRVTTAELPYCLPRVIAEDFTDATVRVDAQLVGPLRAANPMRNGVGSIVLMSVVSVVL